jgi:hypothetical protein
MPQPTIMPTVVEVFVYGTDQPLTHKCYAQVLLHGIDAPEFLNRAIQRIRVRLRRSSVEIETMDGVI